MIPTSLRDIFLYSIFTWFCFSYLSWIGYESLHCRSSYAPAMSPYIYLMTHILFIASSSHTRFPTFALLLPAHVLRSITRYALRATPGQVA